MAHSPYLRRRGASARSVACALVVLAGAAACQGGSPDDDLASPSLSPFRPPADATASATPGAVQAADWPTYHRDNGRSGTAPALTPLRRLSRAWEAKLDGAVYGQPLVVGDRVFAATENDTVYALDPGTGRVLWSTHVGTPVPRSKLPCGNIDPLGITSTMVYDPATRLVFALAELTGGRHVLVGLDVATGALRLRNEAEPPQGDRIAHQQRSALTLLDGSVYIAYGGLAGDCAEYIGSVVAVPTTGTAPLRSYAVPTSREAGIWAPGGGTVAGGRLLYAVGNGEAGGGDAYDGSDSVIALTPSLALADRFTPTTWADDNEKDLDLGSMTPAVVGGFVYADGKRGVGYVLRPDHLGGIGGEVAQAEVCRAFGASAVSGDTLYVPCRDGLRAVTVDASGRPAVRWQASVPARGSPTVGGGAVWIVDYDGGILHALDPATGAERAHLAIGKSPHFASPSLVGHHAYVGTLTGVVAAEVAG